MLANNDDTIAERLRETLLDLEYSEDSRAEVDLNVVATESGHYVELQGTAEQEPFDRAWRRVGLALDRVGFTVEDRDRSKGTYFVRYVAPTDKKDEPGFLSKLFGGGGKDADRTGEPELSFLDVQGVHGSAGFAARLASRSRCKCRGVEDVDGFPVRAFRKLD